MIAWCIFSETHLQISIDNTSLLKSLQRIVHSEACRAEAWMMMRDKQSITLEDHILVNNNSSSISFGKYCSKSIVESR
jgi:hypothetical protein